MNRFRRRYVAAIVVLVGLIVGLYLILRPSKPRDRVVILPFPMSQSQTPARLLGLAKLGLGRVKFYIFGPGKFVSLKGNAFKLRSLFDLAELPLERADFVGTNALHVWLLPNDTITGLTHRLSRSEGDKWLAAMSVQSEARFETSSFNGQSVMTGGTNQAVGLVWDLCPRLTGDSTDLTSIVCLTEPVTNGVVSIRTNMATAARVQIPNGSGVVFFDTNTATMFMVTVERPGR